jgi:hypothetical protein
MLVEQRYRCIVGQSCGPGMLSQWRLEPRIAGLSDSLLVCRQFGNFILKMLFPSVMWC